jgi:ubiquinone/menaquinone biosynthesis C-methylase UbiE
MPREQDLRTYVLGRSEDEARRQTLQAEFMSRSLRAVWQAAGITTGMRVLDLGSGPGGSSLVAAELVGPSGQVIGVEMNPAVIDTARRKVATTGLTNVSFVHGDINETDLGHGFDALVGRFVLPYQKDPVATLRTALRALRDGGIVAFYEVDMGSEVASFPTSSLHQWLGRTVSEGFRRGGVLMDTGTSLYRIFRSAGLDTPRMMSDALFGGGRDWIEAFAATFGATLLRSMEARILEYGIATVEEMDLDTFDQRYVEQLLSLDSVIKWYTCFGAWTRKRAATA